MTQLSPPSRFLLSFEFCKVGVIVCVRLIETASRTPALGLLQRLSHGSCSSIRICGHWCWRGEQSRLSAGSRLRLAAQTPRFGGFMERALLSPRSVASGIQIGNSLRRRKWDLHAQCCTSGDSGIFGAPQCLNQVAMLVGYTYWVDCVAEEPRVHYT